MKTSDLVEALSRDDPRPQALAPTATVVAAVILALVAVVTLSMVWLTPRADLVAALVADNRVVLLKFIFTVGVVAGALPIVRDLSVPGRRLGRGSILAGVPFVVIIALALHELSAFPIYEWARHVDHASCLECLWLL